MAAMEADVPGPGWAVPGAPAEPEGPPRVIAAAVGTVDAPAADRTAGVPRVALRPMTVADILDGGFSIIKARPKRLLTMAAAVIIPVQLFAAFVSRDLGSGLFSDTWFNEDPAVSSGSSSGSLDVFALFAALILPSIALVCIAAAISHMVMGWTVGYDPPGREMLRVVARRWWPLLATFVIVHFAELVGALACYIGTFVFMALFCVVAPVIGGEQASTGDALRRSIELVRPRFWPVLGTVVLMGLVASVLGNVLSALPQGIAAVIGLESGWPLAALGAVIGQLLTTPFVAAATTLLYLDLRIRTEGLDIELAARRAIDRVA